MSSTALPLYVPFALKQPAIICVSCIHDIALCPFPVYLEIAAGLYTIVLRLRFILSPMNPWISDIADTFRRSFKKEFDITPSEVLKK